MQVAIITGEASGDRVAGQLVRELRRLRPDWNYWGTGGKYLREAGAELFRETSTWGVVGVTQGLAVMPKILRAYSDLKHEMLLRKPDLVIPVDAGAFNIGFMGIKGLCPWLREALPGTAILYYFPPGSWRRTLKSTSLAELTDAVATPFPWSETELRRFGVNATFVGHPLLDLVHPSASMETLNQQFGVDPEHPVVGILPGSRKAEIEQILPVQLEAAAIIRRRVPGVRFLLALAPTVDRARVEREIARVDREQAAAREQERALREAEIDDATKGMRAVAVPAEGRGVPPDDFVRRQKEWIRRAAEMPEPPAEPLPISLVDDRTYDVMAVSDVLMACSGTATLEAAILGKPMVIMYRIDLLANLPQYLIVRNRLPEHIGLPNMLAGERIVPELVQDALTPDTLADAIIGFLLEPDRMLQTRERLHGLRTLLGEPGGAARAAQMAIDLVETRARERAA